MSNLPPIGYYAYQNILSGEYTFILFSTGFRMGGGHAYYQDNEWRKLLWNQFPEDIQEAYTFYEQCPPGTPKIHIRD
jgi:hypothetical protein